MTQACLRSKCSTFFVCATTPRFGSSHHLKEAGKLHLNHLKTRFCHKNLHCLCITLRSTTTTTYQRSQRSRSQPNLSSFSLLFSHLCRTLHLNHPLPLNLIPQGHSSLHPSQLVYLQSTQRVCHCTTRFISFDQLRKRMRPSPTRRLSTGRVSTCHYQQNANGTASSSAPSETKARKA